MVAIPKQMTHAQRVDAGTRISTRVGEEGRVRFFGRGKRGNPPIAARDLLDARIALASITRAVENLEAANDEKRSQFDRDEHHRVALGQLSLIWRAVETVLDRNHKRLGRRGPT